MRGISPSRSISSLHLPGRHTPLIKADISAWVLSPHRVIGRLLLLLSRHSWIILPRNTRRWANTLQQSAKHSQSRVLIVGICSFFKSKGNLSVNQLNFRNTSLFLQPILNVFDTRIDYLCRRHPYVLPSVSECLEHFQVEFVWTE